MIEKFMKIIDTELEKCFENKEFDEHKLILEAMKYTTLLPSKKLRSILCLEACRIFSNDYKAALPFACAVEMLHSQSLIHDDLPCMDNDDFRRGKPANHKVYGEDVAVLAGDALISYGIQTIIEKTPKTVPAQTVLEVVKNYAKAAGAFGIVGGQIADMKSEGKKINFDELKFIHKYKTATMFELALVCGAILGGANSVQIKSFEKFAQNYGLAFQIKDDILDVTSTTDELGKTIGKDEIAQKATYVTLFGLEEAKEKLTLLIENCYDIIKSENINSEILTKVLEKLEK